MLGAILASAGASLIGGAMQNRASAKEASASRAFTEKEMKNRHQWEVDDLRKAGLNPILSSHSTPSIGSSAQANVPSNPVGEAASSALAAMRLRAEIENIKQDTRVKSQQERSVAADASIKSLPSAIKDDASGLYNSAKSFLSPLAPKNYIQNSSKRLQNAGENLRHFGNRIKSKLKGNLK